VQSLTSATAIFILSILSAQGGAEKMRVEAQAKAREQAARAQAGRQGAAKVKAGGKESASRT